MLSLNAWLELILAPLLDGQAPLPQWWKGWGGEKAAKLNISLIQDRPK